MRYWQWGLFAAEHADWDADTIAGRSILVWGNGSNQEGSVFYHTEEYRPVGYTTGDVWHYEILMDIKLSQIKAKLGQIPVLLRVDLNLNMYSDTGDDILTWYLHRMFKGWDINDVSNRYLDRSATTTWYGDAYAPYRGQDVETDASHSAAQTAPLTSGDWHAIPCTDIIARALRDNTDVRMLCRTSQLSSSAQVNVNWDPSLDSRRPNMEFLYLYPIEFFESDGSNAPDYSSTVQESEDGHYYIGAVERGATGTPTQGWIRNFTTQTQQVELFDDHPEWSTPVQRAGSGTGELDYVTLASNAPSQLYTVVFYSSTQFEVKAESYRDNSTSYHPQINADAGWRGAVGSNFTTPSGGLTIPSAAWQSAGISSGDEFEIGVRGNTTDSSWPADSNQQVEITKDDSGSADSTAWRPILGHREKTTGSVTISATSVFMPIRHVDTTVWAIGEPAYIHDVDNIDEGTLASVQERALGTVDSTNVSGLDDLSNSGNYNGNSNKTFRVQIDATGSPDTFSWSNDGTTSWEATGVSITGSAQLLEDGVYITFGATTGHTNADYWLFDADTWGVTISGLTVTSNSYSAGAYVSQTLPMRDLGAADWSTVDAASGASQSPASRLYVADTSPFAENDVLHIQQAESDGSYEEATIAAGGVNASGGYLDLTSSLTYDYVNGDFVTVKGTGEAAFWMRPVATSTTVEELKRFRINARML